MASAEPPILDPNLTDEHRNQNTIEQYYNWFLSTAENQFIVYGQFERVNEKPFTHIVEHEQRLERWNENGWGNETSVGIKYTYTPSP